MEDGGMFIIQEREISLRVYQLRLRRNDLIYSTRIHEAIGYGNLIYGGKSRSFQG
jgi:hypothetical protein